MKQFILLLGFIWGIVFNISAQGGFFVKNDNIEKWYIKHDKIEREIKKVMDIPEFSAITKGKIPIEELIPSFHFIDFDNNGIYDLLFTGKIYDNFYTFIFYKKEDNYLLSIGEKGTIIQANLPYQDNGLCFSLWEGACCGEYINVFTQYACVSTNNTSYFNVVNKSLIYVRTVLPFVRIEKPAAFITNTSANVRSEPILDNEKQIGAKYGWKGNTVGLYSPNATGTIYAEMRDNKNQFWYFVRMNNESGIYIHNNRFTADENKGNENYSIYGWIKSDDITIIEN